MSIELILVTLFIVKHFFADFPLQTYNMVCQKGTYLAKGGIVHSGIHAVMTFLILVFFTKFAVLFALLDFIIHYHVDYAKMNLSKKYTPQDNKFWVWLGFDQLLHYLTYVLIIFLAI